MRVCIFEESIRNAPVMKMFRIWNTEFSTIFVWLPRYNKDGIVRARSLEREKTKKNYSGKFLLIRITVSHCHIVYTRKILRKNRGQRFHDTVLLKLITFMHIHRFSLNILKFQLEIIHCIYIHIYRYVANSIQNI